MSKLTLSEYGARLDDEERKTFGRVLDSDPAILRRRNTDLEIAMVLLQDAVEKESDSTLRARVKNILERVELINVDIYDAKATEVGGSLNGGPRVDGYPSTLKITYEKD